MLVRIIGSTSGPPLRRQFCTSSTRNATRFYRYAIDVHGQLFLHDTTPKNLTSCFKNPQFLDFFFARIKPNGTNVQVEEANKYEDVTVFEEDWTERKDLELEEASKMASQENYRWVSPCRGETNFVRAAKSPIVFRELDEDGESCQVGLWTSKPTLSFQIFLLQVPSVGQAAIQASLIHRVSK